MMDVTLALRRLRAAPLFTSFAIVTLACGMGVTTAVYSAIYALGARPLGVEAPDRLALLTRSNAINRAATTRVTADEFAALAAGSPGLAGAAAWLSLEAVVAGPAVSDRVQFEAVTGNYFSIAGAPIVRGRAILAADDRPGAAPVVVLSDQAWRRHFDASPTAIGASIRIGGQPFEVIGVARRDFRGLSTALVGSIAAWMPLSSSRSLHASAMSVRDLSARTLRVVARLAPETTLEAASAAVAAAGGAVDTASPLPPTRPGLPSIGRYWALTALDEATDFGGSERMRIVMVVPLLVLLIACTNLANLVLSRSAARRHEYAVRGALGATRGRMLREALTESAIVVGVGGVLGIGLAHGLLTGAVWILREPVEAMGPSFPLDWQLDPILLAGAAVGVVISMLVAGVFPALQMTRVDIGRSLTTGDAVQSLPRWRGRSNLIALQLGVSATLFLVTMIAIRYAVFEPPPWSDPDPRLAAFTVAEVRLNTGSRTAADVAGPLAEALSKPSTISAAAVATDLPFWAISGLHTPVELWRPDQPTPPQSRGGRGAALIGTTPGLFQTLDIPILHGRTFVAGAEERPAVILDEGVALAVFGDTAAVGKDVVMRSLWTTGNTLSIRTATIVGVVAAGRGPVPKGETRDSFVFVPFADRSTSYASIVARPQPGIARALVPELRAVMREVDQDLAIGASGRGDVVADRAGSALRLFATVLGSMATLALVLACAGLYGALSDIVTRRTREMGIRVALGAGTQRIIVMVLRQGIRPIAEGMFIGFGAAFVIRQLMQWNLSKPVSAIDVGIVVAAAVPLITAGLLAAYLPARRASRVNPNVALRSL